MSWDDEDFDASALIESVSSKPPAAAPEVEDDEEDKTVLDALTPAAPGPAPAGPAQPEVLKQKHLKKEMARKELEEARRQLEAQGVPLDDPRAEELRRRMLQEQADLELAAESLSLKGMDDPTLIGLMGFASADDFEENAKLLAKKVAGASGMKHTNAVRFYKALLEAAAEGLTEGELKDVGKTLTNVTAKKAEKKAPAAKAPAPVKKATKKVYVERDDDYGYDDEMGDDFHDVGGGAGAPTSTAAPESAEAASFDFM